MTRAFITLTNDRIRALSVPELIYEYNSLVECESKSVKDEITQELLAIELDKREME